MNESKSLFTVFNHQPVVLNTVSLNNSSKPCYNTEDKILIVDIKIHQTMIQFVAFSLLHLTHIYIFL